MPELSRDILLDRDLLIEEIMPYIKLVSKGLGNNIFGVSNDDFYHGLRHDQVQLANKLRPHYDYSYKPNPNNPNDPITKKRPNEPEVIKDYRVKMREPVTVSITNKMLTFFGRLFNPRLIKISYRNFEKENPLIASNEGLEEYLSDMPVNGSLLQFLKQVQLRNEEVDPNGWVTVRTIKPSSELEPNELPEPVFFSIPSKNVINYGNNFIITRGTERSDVYLAKGSKNTENSGHVFYVYTPNFTFRFQQFGIKGDHDFLPIEWENHGLGYVPAIQNGGQLDKANIVESLEPANFYYPFLMAAIPHLNVYDELYNNQQAAYILRIFLERYEKRIECKQCSGTGHYKKKGLNVSHDLLTCDACDGKGSVRSKGLFDTWKLTVPEGEEAKSPAGYVSLPTDIIKAIEDKLLKIEFQALSAVNMESLNQSQASSTSGESKKQDRDALYTLLENKKQNLFDRTGQFLANAVNGIRYGYLLGDDIYLNRPSIMGPDRFDIVEVNEIIDLINKLSDNASSKELLKSLMSEVARQQFGINSKEQKMVDAELALNPFALYTEDEILTAKSLGAIVSEQDLTKYLYGSQIMKEAMNRYSDFLDLPITEQQEIFDLLAQELIDRRPEEAPQLIPDTFIPAT